MAAAPQNWGPASLICVMDRSLHILEIAGQNSLNRICVGRIVIEQHMERSLRAAYGKMPKSHSGVMALRVKKVKQVMYM